MAHFGICSMETPTIHSYPIYEERQLDASDYRCWQGCPCLPIGWYLLVVLLRNRWHMYDLWRSHTPGVVRLSIRRMMGVGRLWGRGSVPSACSRSTPAVVNPMTRATWKGESQCEYIIICEHRRRFRNDRVKCLCILCHCQPFFAGSWLHPFRSSLWFSQSPHAHAPSEWG